MHQNYKLLSIICIVFILLILLFKIKSPDSSDNILISDWTAAKPVPFAGYISGYENSETFLQLPIFVPVEAEVTVTSIRSVVLSGGNQDFPCSNYQLSSFQSAKAQDYKFATLSFRVNLTDPGIFRCDLLKIVLEDGTNINWTLGNIELKIVERDSESELLSMREFIVNQPELTNLQISYFNHTKEEITIRAFEFPSGLNDKIKITKYKDFSLSETEQGLNIPPQEERTFLIQIADKNSLIKSPEFYYLLPLVTFQYNKQEVTMPAQTQATIVQQPFTEDFIKELME